MRTRNAFLVVLFSGLLANVATVAGGDVSIILQDGRRRGRERHYEPYRPYYHGLYRRETYSPGYIEPQAYSQQTLPDDSPRDLTAVSQQLYDIKQLLDRKGKEGAITRDQFEAEASYLAEMDKDAHSHAFEQGGHLTGDQEAYFLQQLQQTKTAIDQNLIVH